MDPEIEELKAQVASLQEQLAALAFAREDAGSGGGGEIPTHFFPVSSVPVVPDDVSVERRPHDSSSGADNDKEGALQIKGFDKGTPQDSSTLADYLEADDGTKPTILARVEGANAPQLKYIPIGKLQGGGGGGLSDTVEFVADIDWDTYDHVLRKRIRILNLATGQVTDKPNTTYANGWETAAKSTPISSIIGS